MRLPLIQGLIRRRLLVNFRADAAVVRRLLPEPMEPKLHNGLAIVGICLIRLEEIRPGGVPAMLGLASENAAHRIAVTWPAQNDQTQGRAQGVYIPRRDTGSRLTHFAGGRIFPGEHHLAKFHIVDDQGKLDIDINAADGHMSVRLSARETDTWPSGSCFRSLEDSSQFFEAGAVGYSDTSDPAKLDGIKLKTQKWRVGPLDVQTVWSSYFHDPARFPQGSVEFDHALIMRDIPHSWQNQVDMHVTRKRLD